MLPDTITISSRIDAKTFEKFAIFDTLIRKKGYRSPAIFTGIMLFFACICFSQSGKAQQASLLGFVLLGIGILLPAVYFGNYFYSLKQQAKKLHLSTPKHVYTLTMTDAEDGLTVVTPTGEGGTLRLKWANLFHAYRAEDCIYLFASPVQAFLLPNNQGNVEWDQLWSFLEKKMGGEKLTDRRKR